MTESHYTAALYDFLINMVTLEKGAPVVLIWEMGGYSLILRRSALFAIALNLRGYDTPFVICDGTPVACHQREIAINQRITDWPSSCVSCSASMINEARKYSRKYILAKEFITEKQKGTFREMSETINVNSIYNHEYLQSPVGVFAWRSFCRYSQGAKFEVQKLSHEESSIYRMYLYAALVNTYISDQAIRYFNPRSVLSSHGTFVDYGPPLSLAVKHKIHAIAYASGYDDFTHKFTIRSHIKKYINGTLKTPRNWEKRAERPLDEIENERLENYLKKRHPSLLSPGLSSPEQLENLSNIRKSLRIQDGQPTVCLFTHVAFDMSQDDYSLIYRTVNEWLINSMKVMSETTDVNWIIKIHPGEIKNKLTFGSEYFIRKEVGHVPANIRIIPPNTKINPYDFFQVIDCGITVFGTVGMELAILGKPVITAGKSHYSNKGFTYEAGSEDEYCSLLRKCKYIQSLSLSEAQKELARRYTYLFFIQRHFPIRAINKKQGHWGDLDLSKVDSLKPGNDSVMDLICDCIIDGEDFIMEEDVISGTRPVPSSASDKTGLESASKLSGFDPQGEVFEYDDRILRGIFKRNGHSCQKVLETCVRNGLFDRGIVKTDILNEPELASLGYDMILEHEKVPHIAYAHEWPTEMIKDAALFQLDLNLKLNEFGVTLKDCGVTGNVLFNGTRPVFVDFLSLVFKNELVKESWLTPSVIRSPFQPLWSNKSGYFNEIFCRMFYPYMLFPLYMMHQKRFSETRRRMLQTTLNTCSDVITEKEAMANADLDLHGFYQRALAAREYALVHDDWARFMEILAKEIEQLNVSVDQSNYSGYYEQKGENFGFEPSEDWLPKQHAVHNAIEELRPNSVLDIGANTGWFSILAAKSGCQVVAMDNDEASMNRLYKQSKREGLPILPLVMDILHPTPDVPPSPNLATDPHMINSRIKGDAFMLLSADKRLKCDMVLALAIIHHLTLGQGIGLRKTVELLSSFSHKHLVVEFVPKEDPLIVGEMSFFPAFNKKPSGFEWYTKENWLRELSECYKTIEEKGRQDNRVMFVCSEKK